jgi:hypothetical protein
VGKDIYYGHGIVDAGAAMEAIRNRVDPVDNNTAPVAVDDTASTTQGTPITISVLANDSDADGDPLSVVSVTDLVNGTVVINNDQTITYTPNSSFSGTDSFTYTISDGQGGTATATVSITVSSDDQDAGEAVRVVDIDGSVSSFRNQWRAVVTITVADSSGVGVAGLTVTTRWSDGRSFTGTTNAAGQLTATSAQMNNRVSRISFRVENVDHLDYDPTLNSDPDGDSNGTSITVFKDGSTAAGGFQASNDDRGSASPGRPQDGQAAVTETTATDANRNGRGALTPTSQPIATPLGESASWVALVQQGNAGGLGTGGDSSDVTTQYDDNRGNHGVAVLDNPPVVDTSARGRSATLSLRQRDSLAPLTSTIGDAVHDQAMLAFLAD